MEKEKQFGIWCDKVDEAIEKANNKALAEGKPVVADFTLRRCFGENCWMEIKLRDGARVERFRIEAARSLIPNIKIPKFDDIATVEKTVKEELDWYWSIVDSASNKR